MLSLDLQNEFRERYRLAYPAWHPATEVYADLVGHYFQPGIRVLDLGCGRGGLVEQLNHPLDRVAGVDADWRSLREHRLETLPRTAAVASALPFRAASFELVFSSWLLEHLADPARTLREIGRVLRPEGVFIFITPNKRHPLTILNQLAGRLGRVDLRRPGAVSEWLQRTGWQSQLVERLYGRAAADTFPTWYRANSLSDLQRLGKESGLTLARLEFISDPSYLAFTEAIFRLTCRIEQQLPTERRIHLVGILQKGFPPFTPHRFTASAH
jgi:SAM-dependent methyltransferase